MNEETIEPTEIVNVETGEILTPDIDRSLVFGTQDPAGIIKKATDIANQLADIVEKAKLYSMIKDKKYVRAEGWTTMAAMLGVFPSVEKCEKLERAPTEIAYASVVVLKHLSGAIVGRGEAICSSAERSWGGRDEYAIKSMSQTRALGKACRISFSWIMALSGYEVTPFEEMGNDQPERKVAMPKALETVIQEKPPTEIKPRGLYDPKKPLFNPKDRKVYGEEDTHQPQSKFFVKLQIAAREAGISETDLKAKINSQFGKDSAMDLIDGEVVKLIQEIQGGKH